MIGIVVVCGLVIGFLLVLRRSQRAPPLPLAEAQPASAAQESEPAPIAPALGATPAWSLAPASSATPPSDEASLMQRLRAIEDSDPAQALDLARDGDRRFPKSRDSAERAMIEVKSLAREGKLSEARGAAEVMVNQYPGTPWALEVERHTGAHPHVRH
ncbi:MAG: hypothetical protein ABSF69_20435 [Polyangiaceae bacterium]|jgi:hypothetical protein